jgi:hypothetical protein
MSITASNVGQNNGVVMPLVSDVRLNEEYGWPDTRTGTLDPGGAAPAAPVITGVVDNLDGDSVTVSLTGTGTLQLYYRQKLESTWISGENRSGSGDIVQGGLTEGTWYEMYATAASGGTSAPSNLVEIYLSSTTGTGTIKTAVYAILMGDDDLQALVDGRVTPGGDPARGVNSVTYHQISGIREHTMDGPDTYVTPTMQVNSYGRTDLDANNVADAVRNALDGFSGTVDGVAISYFALDDQGDLDDFEPSDKQVSRHGVRQDYLMSYTEN